MDRFDGNGDRHASEDPSQAREHVRNAEENRDALEAQGQRTGADAPTGVDQPIRGIEDGGGMDASGPTRGSEDALRAQDHVQEAERYRDALESQHRRVENTTPEESGGER